MTLNYIIFASISYKKKRHAHKITKNYKEKLNIFHFSFPLPCVLVWSDCYNIWIVGRNKQLVHTHTHLKCFNDIPLNTDQSLNSLAWLLLAPLTYLFRKLGASVPCWYCSFCLGCLPTPFFCLLTPAPISRLTDPRQLFLTSYPSLFLLLKEWDYVFVKMWRKSYFWHQKFSQEGNCISLEKI